MHIEFSSGVRFVRNANFNDRPLDKLPRPVVAKSYEWRALLYSSAFGIAAGVLFFLVCR